MAQIKFLVKKQDRFEPGKFYPTSFVDRLVILDYSPLGDQVTINVCTIDGNYATPIMQPKHGRLTGDDGKVLKYTDTTNPKFKYEVETDAHNEIVRVSIFAGNPFTQDVIEYRYTI